jgi:hypothetical protein
VVSSWREDAIIDVTMLGASGVGKTTMLASMYRSFREVVGTTDLAVVASDRATSARLQDYLIRLRSLPQELRVKPTPGTEDVHEYLFDVGRRGKKPLFALRFTDYPGNFLTQPGLGTAEDDQKIQRAFNRADVVVVAIDMAALMELNGEYHEHINNPDVITDIIFRMLQEDRSRLIILAPLKCEKYVGRTGDAEEMAKRIEEAYRPLLTYIRSGELRTRIACVLTPVQTIGSVVFSRIELDNGKPTFVFRTKQQNAQYEPQDADQPLSYLMKFIVGKYRATGGVLKIGWLKIIGADTTLVNAMQEFSGRCKTGGGFTVLQDHAYFHVER